MIPCRSIAFRLVRKILELWVVLRVALPVGAADPPSGRVPGTHEAGGRFLVISDLHFDPYLGLSREQFGALLIAPFSEWPQRLSGQPAPHYGSDSPFSLIQGCLDDARKRLSDPDFILLPGDFLAHSWSTKYDRLAPRPRSQDPAAYRAFTGQVMRFLTMRVGQAFPRTPVFSVLGNDDSECGDYQVTPVSPFLAMLSDVWAPLVFQSDNPESGAASRREFSETVSRGGYYSVRLPALSKHRLVVLNTVFCAPQYRNACGDPTATPAHDQFRWLDKVLSAAERQGERVWLLMHLPPGIDGFATHQASGVAQPLWRPELTDWFLQIVRRHEKTIQLVIAGHTHRDDFRVIQLDGRPVLLTKIVPAVSPVYGNNPGYQIFHYDRPGGAVQDYLTLSLPLAPPPDVPAWKVEYQFMPAYGSFRLDPASIAQLGAEVSRGGPARKRYRQYYSVEGEPNPVADSILGCAILNVTVQGFTECSASAAGLKP